MADKQPVTTPAANSLLPGERVLLTLENTPLVLTNYRVKFDAKGVGNSLYQSIPLDSISFCGYMTNSQPWTMLVSLLFLGCGALAFTQPQLIRDGVLIGSILLLLGVAFAIIYFATRSAVVLVRAMCGEQIMIPSHHRRREQAMPFLEGILEAKLRFNRKIQSASN